MDEPKVPILEKGRRIDRYEIRELIGRGLSGAVYRAVETRLGRTVALRTIGGAAAAAGDPGGQRFMRGALAISKVDHRNVVQVLDFGLVGGGVPYVVTEYLRGQTLERRLGDGVTLALPETADILLAVCAALRACHQVGIVHGGLTARKVFLHDTDTGPEVRVIDFGLGETADPATDLRAVGELLALCLAGRPHQRLEAIARKATRPSPGARFESVHALGQDLWELASPLGQNRWKNYYFHERAPDAPTTVAQAPAITTEVRVAPKVLNPTPLLPVREPGRGDEPGGLPIAEAGGTVLAQPTDPSVTQPTDPSVTQGPGERPPAHRSRITPLIAVAGVGALLAAILFFLVFGGQADRSAVDTALPPSPRRVSPREPSPPPEPAPPTPAQPAPPRPETARPPPDNPKPTSVQVGPSRRRIPRTRDRQGIGIPAD